MAGLRRLLHPAWLPVVFVALFVAGVGLGEHTGSSSQTATVTHISTDTTTVDVPAIPGTVTVTRRVEARTSSGSATSSPGPVAVTVRYGRWYGKFSVTGAHVNTSAVGAEVLGQFENTSACGDASVDLDATFYRAGQVIGTGSGAVASAPQGSTVSLDVIGYFSGTPDSVTLTVTDVLCI